MDMTHAEAIAEPSAEGVRSLASLAAQMDNPESPAKFAIVAPQDVAFGMGRMFGAYRDSNPQSKKEVAVFRSMAPALKWLGMD